MNVSQPYFRLNFRFLFRTSCFLYFTFMVVDLRKRDGTHCGELHRAFHNGPVDSHPGIFLSNSPSFFPSILEVICHLVRAPCLHLSVLYNYFYGDNRHCIPSCRSRYRYRCSTAPAIHLYLDSIRCVDFGSKYYHDIWILRARTRRSWYFWVTSFEENPLHDTIYLLTADEHS